MDLKENDILSKDHKNLRNKRIRTIVSFVMIIILLVILFFISVNIGSLKVPFKKLFDGLFIKYNPGAVFCSHQYRKPEGFFWNTDERTFCGTDRRGCYHL